jgi:phospholipid-translocating ATPase
MVKMPILPQFRVANLYFLALVIFQGEILVLLLSPKSSNSRIVFPVFGAASAQTAMLPLVFVITVTAIKDGVEDYRRASLDEEVNTSAATKLGNWRNVNIPTDPRNWFEKLLGLNPPGKVTKGVRKLREKEGAAGNLIMLAKGGDDRESSTQVNNDSRWSLEPHGAGGRRLEDIASVDSHSYPPVDLNKSSLSIAPAAKRSGEMGGFGSLSAYQESLPSRSSLGVVDYRNHTGGSARWERTLWKKLEVGDIVLLRDNDQVPADVVVLSTSDPDGLCYLETKNLDGETNLKVRKAVPATSSMSSEEDIERSSFVLDSEPAHQNLYVYHGVLRYKDATTGAQKQEPVTINELLLRGCAIRNTSWVVGLVVFTGADTKIMLNGGDAPTKRSKIEVETNFNVIVNFAVLLVMCTIAAILSGLYDNMQDTSAKVFEAGDDPTSSSILNALVTFVYVCFYRRW